MTKEQALHEIQAKKTMYDELKCYLEVCLNTLEGLERDRAYEFTAGYSGTVVGVLRDFNIEGACFEVISSDGPKTVSDFITMPYENLVVNDFSRDDLPLLVGNPNTTALLGKVLNGKTHIKFKWE